MEGESCRSLQENAGGKHGNRLKTLRSLSLRLNQSSQSFDLHSTRKATTAGNPWISQDPTDKIKNLIELSTGTPRDAKKLSIMQTGIAIPAELEMSANPFPSVAPDAPVEAITNSPIDDVLSSALASAEVSS
eukprot:tig00001264_g7867.t1